MKEMYLIILIDNYYAYICVRTSNEFTVLQHNDNSKIMKLVQSRTSIESNVIFLYYI